jgi:hypothetical protein
MYWGKELLNLSDTRPRVFYRHYCMIFFWAKGKEDGAHYPSVYKKPCVMFKMETGKSMQSQMRRMKEMVGRRVMLKIHNLPPAIAARRKNNASKTASRERNPSSILVSIHQNHCLLNLSHLRPKNYQSSSQGIHDSFSLISYVSGNRADANF